MQVAGCSLIAVKTPRGEVTDKRNAASWTGFLALLVVSFLLPSLAQGYTMSHEYHSRARGPYGANVYVSQQAQYARTLTLTEGSNPKAGTAIPEKGDYRGHALQTSVGIEHFRFLQTGIFYSNSDVKAATGQARDLRGHELGAEARIVLSSPVVNVGLGGGAYLTRKDYSLGLERGSLQGNGHKIGLDFIYFASSRVSLVLSGAQLTEKLSDKSASGAFTRLGATGYRVGGGLTIWL